MDGDAKVSNYDKWIEPCSGVVSNKKANTCIPTSLTQIFLLTDIPGHVTEEDFCQEMTSQKIKWTRTLRGQTDFTSCPEGVTGTE